MAFSRQLLPRCPKCGEPSMETLETRRTRTGTRRRKCCANCGYRTTTHEVSAEWYGEAEAAMRAMAKVRDLLGDPVVIPCSGCKFGSDGDCSFDYPEAFTAEAQDCTQFSPVGASPKDRRGERNPRSRQVR